MIFVIAYDRKLGRTLEFERFVESERVNALNLRRRLELQTVGRGHDFEVVILEAPSESVLRKTHGRYFGGLRDVIDRAEAESEN